MESHSRAAGNSEAPEVYLSWRLPTNKNDSSGHILSFANKQLYGYGYHVGSNVIRPDMRLCLNSRPISIYRMSFPCAQMI